MALVTANASDLNWADVSEGQPIAGFALPITAKTLVLAVMGTRDVMPYHHNQAFCHRLGIRDAFVNTAYLQALLSRCATDWSGPRAVLTSMSLNMKDQLCLGDVARVHGSVVRTWAEEDKRKAEIDIKVATDQGREVAGARMVLNLVADDVAPVPQIMSVSPPSVELDSEMPEAMRTRLDERVVRHAPFPVSEAQIGYWCDMVRDAHPAYQRTDGSGAHVIAPAASMSIWNLSRAGQLGVTASAPDIDVPDQRAWPNAVDSDWPFEWRAPGAREVIVQRRHAEFGAVVRPGDLIRSTAQLLNCSSRRRTKLGDGYFVSRYEVYQNQNDEVIGSTTMSLFQYGIGDGDE
ncbi:hypothetical protein FEZ60_31695 [Rhodococcus sp. MS16]|uniref:hypothetical protein n=1 Tax=Rhodococcus sp. MS16 TaxID=2579941 RepID=UPI00156235B1|nr:hypothetical protein [Rhodococcus sp. MS16]NRI70071.1 hypothetical protein [Rhodococcus sp. MS16]